MELKRAKEVLEGSGAKITAKLITFYNNPDGAFVELLASGKSAIDGYFTADEHEAIATWMRDPEGVMKA